jgi:hypothetical protein
VEESKGIIPAAEHLAHLVRVRVRLGLGLGLGLSPNPNQHRLALKHAARLGRRHQPAERCRARRAAPAALSPRVIPPEEQHGRREHDGRVRGAARHRHLVRVSVSGSGSGHGHGHGYGYGYGYG